MRALLIPALFVTPALFAAATADAAEDVSYRPDGFLRTGYSDKQVAPEVWRVKGSAHAMGGGVAVALYRAAELAMAARADEVRITSQKVRSQTITRRSTYDVIGFTETATVTVRAVRTAADRAACDEQDPRECMTLPVAGLLARFGDRVGQPTARPGEVPARPVALVTYDPHDGGPAPWQIEAARRWPEPVVIPVRTSPRPAVPTSPTAVPIPRAVAVGLRPAAPASIRLSVAEIEQARLRAAAATDGDPGQGVTIR